MPDSLSSWFRLTLVPGIGGQTQRKLLRAFSSPDAVFSASRSAVSAIIGEKNAVLLLETDNREAIQKAMQWAEGEGQHVLTLADAAYPQRLLQTPDPPSLLYVRGRLDVLNLPTLAIVGSRNPTPQGLQNAEAFASHLAGAGLAIASGMALGIDAAAHRGALLAHGKTIAFVGTGIDRVYPARNHALALEIGEKGAIVSEFPLGTPATAANFPRRNRLISGIAQGVLVVEAAVESGSLITARLAAEQGREVFSIPGSIHSTQSRGCHKLIKQGAKLVETAQDILEELAWTDSLIPVATPPDFSEKSFSEKDEVLEAMGFEPCTLDELATRSALSVDELGVQLLRLELEGKIAGVAGGRYQRLK